MNRGSDESSVVLPSGLGDARRPEALASGPDLRLVGEPKAEVIRSRQPGGHRLGVGEGQLRPIVRAQDQQVIVVEQAIRQAEMLAMDRGRALTVADRQRDLVERHRPITAR